MRVTIFGSGYVGLVTGACLADAGNHVVCVDVDAGKIERLNRGEVPIHEPGLEALIKRNAEAGRIEFTTDAAKGVEHGLFQLIAVGTPPSEDGSADLRHVLAVARTIATHMNRYCIVITKSTVPVGTADRVREQIVKSLAERGTRVEFDVVSNPEFLKEGAAIDDFNKPDRVVVGVEKDWVGEAMKDLYDPFVRNGHPIYLMDVVSAEMVKYASNNFLATKISFINEMANLCEAYGADISRVREGMCADKRIGNAFLYPGLGYGGSCFPKDTLACIMMGETRGVPIPVSKAVHEANQRQRERFFDKIQGHFKPHGGLAGRTLGFWGIAFKPRTDDIREAPALTLMRKALGFGAIVRGFDPVANENARRELGPGPVILEDMYEVARGADALVICTDWDEFKSPDFSRLKSVLKAPVIFDGRNLYRRHLMVEKGFHYHSVGRGSVRPG